MALFNLIASLTIGKPGEQGLKIDGLRIAFDINYTSNSEPNKAEIQIYNLSETTLANVFKNNVQVNLFAGYAEDVGLELLYKGNKTYIITTYNPPDVITKIECGDGADALRDVRLSLSYAAGTTAKTILNDVSNKFGFPVKDTGFDASNITFPNGFSFIGKAKDAMDKVTKNCNADWNIQRGALQIISIGGHNNETVIELTPESGLLGVPERTDDSGFSGDSTKKVKGWKIVSLLQPKFLPGGRVKVDSKVLKGVFNIATVEHKGDTRGSDVATTTLQVSI